MKTGLTIAAIGGGILLLSDSRKETLRESATSLKGVGRLTLGVGIGIILYNIIKKK